MWTPATHEQHTRDELHYSTDLTDAKWTFRRNSFSIAVITFRPIKKEAHMLAADSLKEVYLNEMRDLWSANNQMAGTLGKILGRANDAKLKTMLEHSIGGIQAHSETLKSLIAKNGGEASPEHCKGMEGLVEEALKHALNEETFDGRIRDLQIIAQYQRMTHYGLAGFGTAAAYAKALGFADQEAELKQAVSEIYKGDEYATVLAEAAERAAA